jgi:ATP-binding cassette subfamily F protein 3
MQHHVDQLDLGTSPVGFMAQKYPGKAEEEYRRQLGNFGITGMTGLQSLETLSGGQKSRVTFACLGLRNPHILILDEVNNNPIIINIRIYKFTNIFKYNHYIK